MRTAPPNRMRLKKPMRTRHRRGSNLFFTLAFLPWKGRLANCMRVLNSYGRWQVQTGEPFRNPEQRQCLQKASETCCTLNSADCSQQRTCKTASLVCMTSSSKNARRIGQKLVEIQVQPLPPNNL